MGNHITHFITLYIFCFPFFLSAVCLFKMKERNERECPKKRKDRKKEKENQKRQPTNICLCEKRKRKKVTHGHPSWFIDLDDLCCMAVLVSVFFKS